MAATYQSISKEEMQAALKSFSDLLKPVANGWKRSDARAKEYVYDLPLKAWGGVVIRVYTSIDLKTGQTRKAGSDAIRVCAVDTINERGVMKNKRVHRTQNWVANMRKRLQSMVKHIDEIMTDRLNKGQYTYPESKKCDTVSLPKVKTSDITTVVQATCGKCHGTGRHVVPNNYGGHQDLGTCFQCGGKGHVTIADEKRCDAYWRYRESHESLGNMKALDPYDIPVVNDTISELEDADLQMSTY